MPRNSKLTPELGNRIVALIKKGNFAKVAAEACGISESTYYSWMDKGEKSPKGIFHDFYEAVQQANAVPEVEMVGALYAKGLEGDVRAQIEFLGRRYRDRWGAQQSIKAEVTTAQTTFFLPENGRDGEEE